MFIKVKTDDRLLVGSTRLIEEHDWPYNFEVDGKIFHVDRENVPKWHETRDLWPEGCPPIYCDRWYFPIVA